MSWRSFPTVTHVVQPPAIDAYAELSGDYNPLHVDPEYAAAGPFGTIVAHGPLGLQTVFEALARWLGEDRLAPGIGIEVAYRGPVRAGDAVTASAEGPPIEHAGCVLVRVRAVNQDGGEVLQALLTVPRARAPREA